MSPHIDQAAEKVPQHGAVGPLGPRLDRFVSQEVGERTPGDRVGRLRPAFHDLANNLEQDRGSLVEVAIGGTNAREFATTMIAEKDDPGCQQFADRLPQCVVDVVVACALGRIEGQVYLGQPAHRRPFQGRWNSNRSIGRPACEGGRRRQSGKWFSS